MRTEPVSVDVYYEVCHERDEALAQRDEAVALLRWTMEWICSLPSVPGNEGAATMLVTRINDFLSGLDHKETGDASD